MRLSKKSSRAIAAALCLAAAMTMTGCSGDAPTPPAPSSSSSSSNPSGGTYEEQLYYILKQNSKKPQNQQNSWATSENQVFLAKVSQSGRLYEGKWADYADAANFSFDQALYDYYMKTYGYSWATFFAVPDDSANGTNCVWDGVSLNYYPTNVADKNTYMYKSGLVYEVCVSPDGYLFGGSWVSDSTEHKKNYQYFESFPYNTTNGFGYRWDGVNLQLVSPHVVASSDVMTYQELSAYVGEESYNSMIKVANVDENGRIVNCQPGWVSYSKSFEEAKAWYKEHGYNTCFTEFPIYGEGHETDYIWDGTNFTYSPQ